MVWPWKSASASSARTSSEWLDRAAAGEERGRAPNEGSRRCGSSRGPGRARPRPARARGRVTASKRAARPLPPPIAVAGVGDATHFSSGAGRTRVTATRRQSRAVSSPRTDVNALLDALGAREALSRRGSRTRTTSRAPLLGRSTTISRRSTEPASLADGERARCGARRGESTAAGRLARGRHGCTDGRDRLASRPARRAEPVVATGTPTLPRAAVTSRASVHRLRVVRRDPSSHRRARRSAMREPRARVPGTTICASCALRARRVCGLPRRAVTAATAALR